jgi:hypothetical protein
MCSKNCIKLLFFPRVPDSFCFPINLSPIFSKKNFLLLTETKKKSFQTEQNIRKQKKWGNLPEKPFFSEKRGIFSHIAIYCYFLKKGKYARIFYGLIALKEVCIFFTFNGDIQKAITRLDLQLTELLLY